MLVEESDAIRDDPRLRDRRNREPRTVSVAVFTGRGLRWAQLQAGPKFGEVAGVCLDKMLASKAHAGTAAGGAFMGPHFLRVAERERERKRETKVAPHERRVRWALRGP